MAKKNAWIRGSLFLAVLLSFVAACGREVRLNTISPPSPTAKLRVFVQPVSTSERHEKTPWKTSLDEVEKGQRRLTQNFLERKGIYEVVPQEEVKTVLGKKLYTERDWETRWSRRDWQFARQVGKALHAEYAMFPEPSWRQEVFFWDLTLINVETGKKFRISVKVPGRSVNKIPEIIHISYREIFREAKSDMMATAMRKGRLAAGISAPPTALPEASAATPPPTKVREVDFEEAIQMETMAEGQTRLAIYDLEAPEPFKTVALILAEALREELFRLGRFTLINRENIVQVMNEMGLQQSGLVDEKQAIQAGKGMAARQIITGKFGVVGKTSVLQAKRIDVETQGTLSLGSLKCDLGKEDELLQNMSQLARRLVGGR